MSKPPLKPRRSLIFAPGNKPELFAKAMKSGADILTIDLEDAIAPQHKTSAREKTIEWFASNPIADDSIERIIRINCIRSLDGLEDLSAIIQAGIEIPAIMLTKTKSPDEIQVYDELLKGPLENTRLHVIIETNEGLENCNLIAQCCNRIDSILFGGVDMSAELRVQTEWTPLLYARSRLVHAAATANIDLIDVPYLDLENMSGLKEEVEKCAELGITGKAAIHPKQISIINKAFTPTLAEVDKAREIIEKFEQSDSGLVLIDNKLIEKPVLRSLYRTLAIADRLPKQDLE